MNRAVLALVVAAAAGVANAQTVQWSFNVGASSGAIAGADVPLPFPGSAPGSLFTTGSALGAPNAVEANAQLFGGTTVNDVLGLGAGNDLAMQWGASGANAGNFYQFAFDGSAFTGFTLSFASRATGTGPSQLQILTSADGVVFAPLTTVTIARTSTYAASSGIILPTSLAGDSSVYFRIAPLWNDGNHTSSGNIRLDNVVVANVVPTPATAALLGLSGVFASRRRRA